MSTTRELERKIAELEAELGALKLFAQWCVEIGDFYGGDCKRIAAEAKVTLSKVRNK